MTIFIKAGTELRCVVADGSETINCCDEPFKLEVGKVYKTVSDSVSGFVELEDGPGIQYRNDRFEFVNKL